MNDPTRTGFVARRPRRVLAAMLPIILSAAAPVPDVPVYRIFGDWVVACDNARACEARGYGEGPGIDMRIRRQAGPAAAMVALTVPDGLPDGPFFLDGKVLVPTGSAWTRSREDGDDTVSLATSDPVAVRHFLGAIQDGSSLADGRGDAPTIPLDGMRAALLLIDAVQGRPGTQAPLIAPSGTADSPPAPPLPVLPRWVAPSPLSRTEAHALIVKARQLPSPPDEPCRSRRDAELYALDASWALAIRECVSYPYQSSALVYVFPREGGGVPSPFSSTLPGIPEDLRRHGPSMLMPEFDPDTGTLSILEKGTGTPTTGLAASWRWEGGRFRLSALDFLDKDGEPDPGDFLALFRSDGTGRK